MNKNLLSGFNEADYYEPKRLLVIAIDKSASMQFCGMQELNICLNNFIDDAKCDIISYSSVELSVIAFNQELKIICETSRIIDVELPQIATDGSSNVIVGVEGAINIVKERLEFYKSKGWKYYKPWVVLITNNDNQNNSDVAVLAEQIRKDVHKGLYQFLPVGIGHVSMTLLEDLKGTIMPVKLQEGRYGKFFSWLSSTIGNFSLSMSPIKMLNEIRPKIFISYKRVDKQKVIEVKRRIENELDVICWFDVDGIESDAQFANVIIKAINECEIFLFMYSHAHVEIKDLDNDWTIREINFAQKKKKRIVFVNIDGSSLTDWFELMFGTKQQIDANSVDSMDKLLEDIDNWLDLY